MKSLTKTATKHFVYILRCADGTLYTGYTTNLDKRLAEHNGLINTKAAQLAASKYTRTRRPVVIIYYESFQSRSVAMQREYAIKQLTKTAKERLVSNK